jgi:hypothetical protein
MQLKLSRLEYLKSKWNDVKGVWQNSNLSLIFKS